MGTIVISQNASLDGVVQDPTGEEGFRFGGWFGQVGERDREEWAKVELDEVLRAEALLLGRRSDEWFAERWTSRAAPRATDRNAEPRTMPCVAPSISGRTATRSGRAAST